MSRRGWSASNYLSRSTAVVTAVPLTIACWCKTSITAAFQYIVSIENAGTDQFNLLVNTTNNVAAETTAGGVSSSAATSTAFSANTSFHACAVFASATDRRAFLNGAGKGTNATSRTPAAPTATHIGNSLGVAISFAPAGTGDLGEVAIWKTALSDADVARHASGIDAIAIQREFLVALWRLDGGGLTEVNAVNRNLDISVVGALSLSLPPPKLFMPQLPAMFSI